MALSSVFLLIGGHLRGTESIWAQDTCPNMMSANQTRKSLNETPGNSREENKEQEVSCKLRPVVNVRQTKQNTLILSDRSQVL